MLTAGPDHVRFVMLAAFWLLAVVSTCLACFTQRGVLWHLPATHCREIGRAHASASFRGVLGPSTLSTGSVFGSPQGDRVEEH